MSDEKQTAKQPHVFLHPQRGAAIVTERDGSRVSRSAEYETDFILLVAAEVREYRHVDAYQPPGRPHGHLRCNCRARRNAPQPPNWKPKLGVLCQYSDSNLDFVKSEGFTSMQLRLDPDKLDDAAIARIKDKIQRAGLYVSSLAVMAITSIPIRRFAQRQNDYAREDASSYAASSASRILAGNRARSRASRCRSRSTRSFASTTRSTFRLWRRIRFGFSGSLMQAGRTSRLVRSGWEALFKAFNNSPHVGLQFDPSHLVWQFMDPVAGCARFR